MVVNNVTKCLSQLFIICFSDSRARVGMEEGAAWQSCQVAKLETLYGFVLNLSRSGSGLSLVTFLCCTYK